MTAVDFGAWASPALVLTLPGPDDTPGGRTYTVRPPSVADAPKVIALAIRGEVNLLGKGKEVPAEVRAILDDIRPDEHPALGKRVYKRLVADGHDQVTIDRMAFYAIYYWARGKEYADTLCSLLWAPRDPDDGVGIDDTEYPAGGGAAPKD